MSFNPVAWVKELLAQEPVLISWLLNGGLAVLAAFTFHFSHTQEAAAATIIAALVSIFTALRTAPVNVSLVTGAFATGLTALAAFGFHLAPHTIAVVVGVLSFLLAHLHRAAVSPR